MQNGIIEHYCKVTCIQFPMLALIYHVIQTCKIYVETQFPMQ